MQALNKINWMFIELDSDIEWMRWAHDLPPRVGRAHDTVHEMFHYKRLFLSHIFHLNTLL